MHATSRPRRPSVGDLGGFKDRVCFLRHLDQRLGDHAVVHEVRCPGPRSARRAVASVRSSPGGGPIASAALAISTCGPTAARPAGPAAEARAQHARSSRRAWASAASGSSSRGINRVSPHPCARQSSAVSERRTLSRPRTRPAPPDRRRHVRLVGGHVTRAGPRLDVEDEEHPCPQVPRGLTASPLTRGERVLVERVGGRTRGASCGPRRPLRDGVEPDRERLPSTCPALVRSSVRLAPFAVVVPSAAPLPLGGAAHRTLWCTVEVTHPAAGPGPSRLLPVFWRPPPGCGTIGGAGHHPREGG